MSITENRITETESIAVKFMTLLFSLSNNNNQNSVKSAFQASILPTSFENRVRKQNCKTSIYNPK